MPVETERTAEDTKQTFADLAAADAADPSETQDTAPAGDDHSADAEAEGGQKTAEETAGDDHSADEDGQDDPFTPEILARAEANGISEEEARAFGSPEAVQHAVSHFTRRMLAAGEAALQAQETEATATTPARAATEPDTARAATAAAPVEGAYEVGISADDYDEGVVGEMQKMSQHYAGQVEAVRAEFREYRDAQEAAVQERVDQAFNDRLDARFLKADDELAKLIGKGPMEGLAKGSEASNVRNKVWRTMKVIAHGYLSNNVPLPNEDALYDEALRVALPKHFEKQALSTAKKQAREQLRGQDGRYTAEPTSREANAGMTGEEAARAGFGKIYEKANA